MTAPPVEHDAFDAATAVEALGDGRFAVELDEAYTVVGMPNGGYLLAVAARAAGVQLSDGDGVAPDCLGASVAYARALRCGEAIVRVAVDRRGARVSQVHAEIEQDGRTSVRALLSMGRLRGGADVRLAGADPIGIPARDACVAVPSGPPGTGVAIMDRVELRLDPSTASFEHATADGVPEVRGWVRLADGRVADALGLCFLADVLPPSTMLIGSTGWVPTIQLTVYLKALPADGWLLARQYARSVAGGLLDQACDLWDERGVLVASATQLAMVRFG